MCGFVAELALPGGTLDLRALETATDLLAHRGPDDRTVFTEAPYAVGFRRLSIFDLSSAARQPMVSRDGRHVLAFNGAIYNWPELRRELEGLGHSFATHGDTEVLLAAWREWGTGCLARLNGMFAFLVWDRIERRLSGARDRFGVKPLFWSGDGKSLRFASEIKALRALAPAGRFGIDWNTMADFAANDRLDTREETFFEGIRRVPAGTCFTSDSEGRIVWTRWWSLTDAVASRLPSSNPAEEFADTFEDAVRLRMRADVDIGVLLSGGLDSTSIICAMARMRGGANADTLHAFNFNSPDPAHDESDAIAATVAQTGARLQHVVPTPLELWNSLDRHLWYHDEPVYSFSSLISERLIAAARHTGVKVLLNGQGADEVLGGYPSYFGIYWSELLRSGRFPAAIASMRGFARGHAGRAGPHIRAAIRDAAIRSMRAIPGAFWLRGRRHSPARSDWVAPELASRAEQIRPLSPASLESALRASMEYSELPLYLRQEDRNAMAHGVEARLPFLDHRLVTLAFGLGAEWKLAGPYGKVLLRTAMRGRIPEVVRMQVRKLGFATPVDAWFRGPLYEPMRDLIASREFRECGIWQPDRIANALELHRAGRASYGNRLFDVAQTSAWLRAVVAAPLTAGGRAS